MSNNNRLGTNIRGLRLAHGETQEELGEAIFVEKNTVSYYESGKREPNKETLLAIAVHYSVPVEALLNCNFTFKVRLMPDENVFFKNIYTIFPIISSERALSNPNFRKAYEAHMALYKLINKMGVTNFEYDVTDTFDFDQFLEDIEVYEEVLERDDPIIEAASNLLALIMLWLMFLTWPFLV